MRQQRNATAQPVSHQRGGAKHGLDFDDAVAAGRYLARQKMPYFTAALIGLAVRRAPGLGTMAVTETGIMLIDPEVVVTWDVTWIAGGMLHEVGHWLRDHWKRGAAMGADPVLWNFAGDIAINGDLRAAGLALPPGALYHDDLATIGLKDVKLEPGLTQEEYYALLRDKLPKLPMPTQQIGVGGEGDGAEGGGGDGDEQEDGAEGGGGGSSADHEHDGEGDPKSGGDGQGGGGEHEHDRAAARSRGPQQPQVGGGWCGSCAGRPVPGEPEGGDPYARSKAEVDRIRQQVAAEIQEHASANRGNIPGGWKRWADDIVKPPKVPWTSKLARSGRGALSTVEGIGHSTYSRPSRRQVTVGYGPGRPVFPGTLKSQPTVDIVVDTSGSMGREELVTAASETNGILRALGAPVHFYALDCEIHKAKPVKSWREAVALFAGGGGTDFRPYFEHIRALPPHKRPSIVVFITDGCGPAPTMPPPVGTKCIWVLVGPYAQKPYMVGEDDEGGWRGTGPVTWGDPIFVDRDEAEVDDDDGN